MACPCCGPKWLCYQCCCPDGSAPPQSLTVRMEPNSSYRPGYSVFEGTHNLGFLAGSPPSYPPWLLPLLQPAAVGIAETCVSYEKTATGGCNGLGAYVYMRFTLCTNGVLKTDWGWLGVDDVSRCVYAGGTIFGYQVNTQVANICSGAKGILFPDAQFRLLTYPGQQFTAQAAFDVFVD